MKILMRSLPRPIFLITLFFAFGCNDDDLMPPGDVNPEEIITDVNLIFTPVSVGEIVTATAKDIDGEGPLDLEVTKDIVLNANTTYTLSMVILNAEDPADIEDITKEIDEEKDEHMFFFAWTESIFSDPAGNGNADNRSDAVNYNDKDENGLPVGLSSSWTTGETTTSTNTFRVVLKHQPPVNSTAAKTATSAISDGDTDIDITWEITIQ